MGLLGEPWGCVRCCKPQFLGRKGLGFGGGNGCLGLSPLMKQRKTKDQDEEDEDIRVLSEEERPLVLV